MNNSIFKSRFVAAILTGIVVLGTPLYIVAEDEDLTNQLDSIQQQVNQQNAKKADAETVIVSVSEQLRQIEVPHPRSRTAEIVRRGSADHPRDLGQYSPGALRSCRPYRRRCTSDHGADSTAHFRR